MLRKTLLTLSAGMLLGTVVIAPNAALAQLPGPPPMGFGGPPVGGPPPGLGAGGSPLGGPPLRTPSVGLPVDPKVVLFTVAPLFRLGSLV